MGQFSIYLNVIFDLYRGHIIPNNFFLDAPTYHAVLSKKHFTVGGYCFNICQYYQNANLIRFSSNLTKIE